MRLTTLARLAVLVWMAGGGSAAAQASSPSAPIPTEALPATADPFSAGLRWSHASPASAPWIPRDVAFAARGEWIWAGPSVGNPHLLLLAAAEASSAPLFVDSGPALSTGPLLVRAGDDPDELFSLAQFATPGGLTSRVQRHDPVASAAAGTPFTPLWVYDPGLTSDRVAHLACDASGETLVFAVQFAGGIAIDWIDGGSGTRLSRRMVGASALADVAVSGDAGRVALVSGATLIVIERDGTLALFESLAFAPRAVDLSSDGSTLVVGGLGEVLSWRDDGTGFAPGRTILASSSELPAELAVDATGDRLAVGFWNFATGVSVRLEVWDLQLGTRRVSRTQSDLGATLQNFPQAVAITEDGSRAAFGLWGTGDGRPEVLLVDVAADVDLLAIDLAGSVQALALDASGTRLCVARKDGHANAFGTTGAIELHETGERDLVLLSQPRRGGGLQLAARGAGSSFTIYVVGTPLAPSAPPVPLPPHGDVWLDTALPLHPFGAGTAADGTSTLELSIPDLPELVGVPVGVQAVFAGPAPGGEVLSRSAVVPVIL